MAAAGIISGNEIARPSLTGRVGKLTDAQLLDEIRALEEENARLRLEVIVEATRRAALQLRLGMMARARPVFERRN